MKIQTSRFGELEIEEDKVLAFPEGVIGFQKLTRFVLMGKKEKMVMWLQAVDKPEIAFIVVNPYLFEPTYAPQFSDEDLRSIQIEDKADLNILTIVVVPEDPRAMTANLLGPIIVNNRTKMGKQVILTDSQYSVKHPVVKDAPAVEVTEQKRAMVG